MFTCCCKKKVTKVSQRGVDQEPVASGDKQVARRENSSEAELQDFSVSNHQHLDSISSRAGGSRPLFTIDEYGTSRNGMISVKVHGSNPNEA